MRKGGDVYRALRAPTSEIGRWAGLLKLLADAVIAVRSVPIF
jgi:hypothetical protein